MLTLRLKTREMGNFW